MEPIRNPSPPPEILNNEELVPDRIGDTIYSKTWIYKTLMSIIEFCDKPSQSEEPSSSTEKTIEIVELDPKIEEIACSLWDMSANEAVAEFLDETEVPAMFIDIIDKTKSPRLLEIVIGILGNMSSYNSVCENISKNKSLVTALISLSGTSDSLTLIQVFRVLLCGIINENCTTTWREIFESNSFFMENLYFILQNNLNRNVLHSVLRLLNYIIIDDKKLCDKWSDATSIEAITEAGLRLSKKPEMLSYFFTNLSIIAQHSDIKMVLANQISNLYIIFSKYIGFSSYDTVIADESSISSIILCYEMLSLVIKSSPKEQEKYFASPETINDISKCYGVVTRHIRKLQNDLDEDDMEKSENIDISELISKLQDLTDLAKKITSAAKLLLPYLPQSTAEKIVEEIIGS